MKKLWGLNKYCEAFTDVLQGFRFYLKSLSAKKMEEPKLFEAKSVLWKKITEEMEGLRNHE